MCGGEARCSETEPGCNHVDMQGGKDIDPGSEKSEMERNEGMAASSCVGLALRCE